MSKNNKTRHEKMLADNRRSTTDHEKKNQLHSMNTKISYTLSSTHPSSKKSSEISTDFQYQYKNLLKTGMITGVILIFELLFFVLLQQKIIVIPFLNF